MTCIKFNVSDDGYGIVPGFVSDSYRNSLVAGAVNGVFSPTLLMQNLLCSPSLANLLGLMYLVSVDCTCGLP